MRSSTASTVGAVERRLSSSSSPPPPPGSGKKKTALLPPPPASPATGAVPTVSPRQPYSRSTSDATTGAAVRQNGTALEEDVMVRTLPGARKVLPKGPPPPVPPNRPLSVSHLLGGSGPSPARPRAATVDPPAPSDGALAPLRPPVPVPRKTKPPVDTRRRCRTLYDCQADNPDELSFKQGQVVIISKERVDGEDDSWMEGFTEDNPERKGIFPVTFVTFI